MTLTRKIEEVTPSCGCVFCDLDMVSDDEGYHWVIDWVDGKVRFKCPIFDAPSSPHPKADQQ